MNVRCVSAICIATIAFAVSAKAQFVPIVVLVERIPAGSRPAGGWTTSSSVNAEYVSWTIPAGVRYDGVIINAHLSGVGGTGTGTAYLYSAPGTSGTLTSGAALVAANAVSVTGNVPDFAPTNLFQGLTLSASSGPVTYYLLLVPSNSFLAWDTSVATTTYTAAGVTSNPDQGATAAVASPPSASTWSALSPNGMLFEVFTFTPPSTIGTTAAAPSLSPAVLFLAALLLGSLGWLLVAPQAIENGKRRYGEDIRETSLPQETQQMHAVSFNKGCYLGQEIVERIRAQGRVNRKLMRVVLEGAEAPAAGTKTTEAGRRRR
jgi:folate-binding protein YgfZ